MKTSDSGLKVFLIRHGQTTGDVEDRYGGDFDDCLSEKGKKQAKELAGKLVGKEIEIIFHSSRKRAAETAKIVAEVLKKETKEIKDLREGNKYGILTGLIKAEAKKKFPEEVEKLSKHRFRTFVTGSEDYDSFAKRVIAAFEKVSDSKNKTIAIVTHGGPISALFREFFKFGELKTIDDCSIIVLEKKGKDYSIVSMQGAELEGK